MVVYGDPSYRASVGEIVERLRSFLPSGSLEEARSFLVLAGQLEQATTDAGLPPNADVTDRAAELFLALRQSGSAEIEGLGKALAGVAPDDSVVTVKIPEGFAFYSLYPETYVASAARWMAEHPDSGAVLLIGLRSIGTALSALLAATLRAGGREIRRTTVRPTGDPFHREVDLPDGVLEDAEWVLIADEGPGLSGSSFVSVAEAVVRAGGDRDRIVFFPSHGGMPGAQASPEVRAWWENTPRYVTDVEEIRWAGRSLLEALADRTKGEIAATEELTGGRWRELVYESEADWPGVAAAFERRKIRVVRRDGTAVLWTFVGFVPLPGQEIERVLGFVGRPWIEGSPLRRADATPELLRQIGEHIAAVAGPPFLPEEAKLAQERLLGMLQANVEEALASLALPSPVTGPTYGDGRMASYHWIRTPEGEVHKTGGLGRGWDHTIVGRQPVAWDIAGAMVEWDLDEDVAAPLLAAAPSVDAEALRFYRAAYAAFRIGMCSTGSGSAEGERLARDEAFYRKVLRMISNKGQ